MTEDKSEQHTFPRFWLFVILVLGSVILGDLNQRMADARGLENDLEYLQARSEQLDEELLYLDEQIELVDSDDFIDDWAHEEGKMVKDNEVLVIFVPTGVDEGIDQSIPASNTTSAEKIEVWLELIFGR
jgi:cell division protein FtsB